jgi:hypothetical protein
LFFSFLCVCLSSCFGCSWRCVMVIVCGLCLLFGFFLLVFSFFYGVRVLSGCLVDV